MINYFQSLMQYSMSLIGVIIWEENLSNNTIILYLKHICQAIYVHLN